MAWSLAHFAEAELLTATFTCHHRPLRAHALRANELRLKYLYVRDESQKVARTYGALRTLHFYMFAVARCGQ